MKVQVEQTIVGYCEKGDFIIPNGYVLPAKVIKLLPDGVKASLNHHFKEVQEVAELDPTMPCQRLIFIGNPILFL